MISSIHKKTRIRLRRKEYGELRHRVLRRDGWRCQVCGSAYNLQIHHLQSRHHLGHDIMENLISLCVRCHGKAHSKTFSDNRSAQFTSAIGPTAEDY